MGRSTDESFLRRPLPDLFVRWSVPTVYGVCCLLICANLWEDYQRVKLAEEVARVVNEGNPQTVEEFEALVADHLVDQLRDYPDSDDPSHSYRGFQLSPRVWLLLWVEYDTETGHVVDTWMIYGGSERVSLHAPTEGLPETSAGLRLMLVLSGIACGGLWLWSSQRGTWIRYTLRAIAVLPLLLYLPLAMFGFLRVIM